VLSSLFSRISKLPSIAWVVLLPLGLIAFIGSIIFGFWALATIEGVASVILVGAGWLGVVGAIRPGDRLNPKLVKQEAEPFVGIVIAAVIVWYALMGMAIDQTGNPLFNYPLRFFCPAGSSLNRDINVYHLLPGRTDIIQDYTCFDNQGKVVKKLDMFMLIGTRFVEYLVIAYAMIGLRKLMVRR
jgi:hypothetical protein